MEFIDLSRQQEVIRAELENRIKGVLNHGTYIMGPEVKELEERLAAYVGVKHAIGCASGTDALLLALMVFNIGQGDAVFTTPFTFIATAEVISLLGATPIFSDIDPVTFNINPEQLELAVLALKNNDASIHPLPSYDAPLAPEGIITVDLFGSPADYDAIGAIAHEHGLFVIQDAAQSFGAKHKDKKACKQGDISCTSFFPAKPLGCYGDGGMCFTDDDDLARRLDSLRLHGKGEHKYDNVLIGVNGRLDTLQAAILLAKFDIFPEELLLRQQAAERYGALLDNDSCPIITPTVPENCTSVWAQYSVLARDVDHRSALRSRLREADIPTAVYYPKPLHLQTAFSYLNYEEGDFSVSKNCASRIFSLPMHPYLMAEDQQRIANEILSSHS